MCLTVNLNKTRKLKQKHQNGRNAAAFIYCYKKVEKHIYDNKVYLLSPYQTFKYKKGLNRSSRKTTKLTVEENKNFGHVNRGFHVYEHQLIFNSIKVKCYWKDFVAIGRFNSHSSLVFTRFYIEEKEYNNVLGIK